MSKLLVATPTTGASGYLGETVDSLRHIAGTVPWSHTIACPEGVAGDLRATYTKTKVVVESSPSMYGAINDAARAGSDWSWLTYINDDDFFMPGMAELVEKAIEYDSTVPMIVYSRVVYVKADGSPICEFPIVRNPKRLLDYYRIECNPVATHGTLINRAAFESLGGFDASYRYAGDMDFFVRALCAGIQFQYVPIRSTAFRLHGDNLTADFDRFAQEEARVRCQLDMSVAPRQAKMWRMLFVAQNWYSYVDRLKNTGRIHVNSYLSQLGTHETRTNPTLPQAHG